MALHGISAMLLPNVFLLLQGLSKAKGKPKTTVSHSPSPAGKPAQAQVHERAGLECPLEASGAPLLGAVLEEWRRLVQETRDSVLPATGMSELTAILLR